MSAGQPDERTALAILDAHDRILAAADAFTPPAALGDIIVASIAQERSMEVMLAIPAVAAVMYERGELDDATGHQTLWVRPEGYSA